MKEETFNLNFQLKGSTDGSTLNFNEQECIPDVAQSP